MSLSAERTAGHDKPGGETGMAVPLAGKEERKIERFGLEYMHAQAQICVYDAKIPENAHKCRSMAKPLDPSPETHEPHHNNIIYERSHLSTP